MTDRTATITLPPELAAGLDELAEATGRSRSELVAEAVAEYLDVQRSQIEGVRAALRELETGEPGVPHEEVARWLDSWGTETELPAPDRTSAEGKT